MASGFLNVYKGDGYEKLIKIDYTDENFFKNMFQKEIVNT